eukprot:UN27133
MQYTFDSADCAYLGLALEGGDFSENACVDTTPCSDAMLNAMAGDATASVADQCTNGADDITFTAYCPSGGAGGETVSTEEPDSGEEDQDLIDCVDTNNVITDQGVASGMACGPAWAAAKVALGLGEDANCLPHLQQQCPIACGLCTPTPDCSTMNYYEDGRHLSEHACAQDGEIFKLLRIQI